jgi:hypothetical protein
LEEMAVEANDAADTSLKLFILEAARRPRTARTK